jgi:aspartyl/glutamyl-tRNA(Asn/Gln) amidotransferase C subunit
MIQKEEIEHMGWLARIELSEADKELFVKQISSILDYFAVLDEVETATWYKKRGTGRRTQRVVESVRSATECR